MTADSKVEFASFTFAGSETLSMRSAVLYFEQVKSSGGMKRTHGLSGPAAIERYLESDEKGRLVQSLKSHLASHTLTGTEVFGRRHRLEELISRILSDLRKQAEKQFDRPIRRAVVGRPVRFVGAERTPKTTISPSLIARGSRSPDRTRGLRTGTRSCGLLVRVDSRPTN